LLKLSWLNEISSWLTPLEKFLPTSMFEIHVVMFSKLADVQE